MTILSAVGAIAFFIAGIVCLIVANRNEPPITADRKKLAEKYGFALTHANRTLMRYWRGGPLFGVNPDSIINIASGQYKGDPVVVCDVRGRFIVVAVRRKMSSSVVMDIRSKNQPLPHPEERCEMIAGSGNRVVYSNNESVARRVITKEFMALLQEISPKVQVIWCEGSWSLATLPLDCTLEDIEYTIECTQKFSQFMKILPPRRSAKKRELSL